MEQLSKRLPSTPICWPCSWTASRLGSGLASPNGAARRGAPGQHSGWLVTHQLTTASSQNQSSP
jgi:hypothetical protein